jgi:hypothetical protein
MFLENFAILKTSLEINFHRHFRMNFDIYLSLLTKNCNVFSVHGDFLPKFDQLKIYIKISQTRQYVGNHNTAASAPRATSSAESPAVGQCPHGGHIPSDLRPQQRLRKRRHLDR